MLFIDGKISVLIQQSEIVFFYTSDQASDI